MAHTLWNDDDRRALSTRLERLTPNAERKWGRMDAPAMLVHITDTLKSGTGELKAAPKPGPFSLPVIKTLVMFHLPWPKGVPTAPELLARKAEGWDAEVARFHDAMNSFVKRPRDGAWPIHVAFGKINGSQWGRLMYRHIDHHFTQFGV